MNSNLLHQGEYYAWYPQRPKGRTPIGAAKIRVNSIIRSKPSVWEKNRKTEVIITVVEVGNIRWIKEGATKTVPAREILDYWDSYKDEEALLIEEMDRRNYDQRRRDAKVSIVQNLVSQRLAEKGLPIGDASVNLASVNIRTDKALDWLQIPEEEIDEALDRAVGPPVESDSKPDFLGLLEGK